MSEASTATHNTSQSALSTATHNTSAHSIGASHISAHSIGASHISAHSIGASHISAHSIGASHLSGRSISPDVLHTHFEKKNVSFTEPLSVSQVLYFSLYFFYLVWGFRTFSVFETEALWLT